MFLTKTNKNQTKPNQNKTKQTKNILNIKAKLNFAKSYFRYFDLHFLMRNFGERIIWTMQKHVFSQIGNYFPLK